MHEPAIKSFAGVYGTDQFEAASGGRREALFAKEGDIAVIDINGPMFKGSGKFGFTYVTDTAFVRKQVRSAAEDDSVSGIMLHIDSPGGMVAGTSELHDDIAAAAKAKPVHAHGDDLVASAAMWVASAANRITMNKAGEVGSIGVFAVAYDFSEAFENEGVKVHVISSGGVKGAFAPGAEITSEQLAELQGRIDGINDMFTNTVAKGRGMTMPQVRKINDGRVFSSSDGVDIGLIDGVASFEKALDGLQTEARRQKRAVASINRGRMKIAENIVDSAIN